MQVLAKTEAGKEMKGEKRAFFSPGVPSVSLPQTHPSLGLLYVQEGENDANLQAYHMHYRY